MKQIKSTTTIKSPTMITPTTAQQKTKETRKIIALIITALLLTYFNSTVSGTIKLYLLCEGYGLSAFTLPIIETDSENIYQVADRLLQLHPFGSMGLKASIYS